LAGLELILDTIINDAKKVADEKIESAKKQIEIINSEYDAEIQKVKENSEKDLEETKKLFDERFENEKKAYKREMLLKEERAVATEIIDAAKEKIFSMPKEEYFAFLTEIFKNQNDFKSGEVLLCKEDRENMPTDFIENLGSGFTLSNEVIKNRGILVRNGRVEINLTINAIFHEIESRLYDIACCKE